jgi:hypothetical protein
VSTNTFSVVLIGNHPHAGEHGRIVITDGKILMSVVAGKLMVRVELDDCQHNESGCFADKEQLRVL